MVPRQVYLCLLIGLLSIVSFASAQTFPQSSVTPARQTIFFGATTGYIKTDYIYSSLPSGASLHFGVQNRSGFTLRVSGNYRPQDGDAVWGVGADGFNAFVRSGGLAVYGGAGAKLFFGDASYLADAHALLGSEFRLGAISLAMLGFFAELHIGAALGYGQFDQPAVPSFSTLVGFNLYF